MYLMYVDSSGNPTYTDSQKAFCLTGIIIHESKWIQINNFVNNHKSQIFPNLLPSTVEYHAKEIYDRQNLFSHLTNEQCKELFRTFYQGLESLDFTIISVYVNKSEIMKRGIRFNPILDLSWERLLERFDGYIKEQNKVNRTNEYGLVISDSQDQTNDIKLRDIVSKIIIGGNRFHAFTNIVEDVMFAHSHWRNLTQIADMIGYCIFKKKTSNEFFLECFRFIEPKFWYSSDGRYVGYGLKIIPYEG